MNFRPKVGAVVIGRNEGPRLAKAIRSVRFAVDSCVYVDSGSTDGSANVARRLGAHVIELDAATPMNAARARNEGFEALLDLRPDLDFVQFVDGDCQVVWGWLWTAARELERHPKTAVVCGGQREYEAQSSVFKRLMDMELELPKGELHGCHGNAMFRVDAFRSVEGFNTKLVAGEEGDLCQRLRDKGHTVFRIDHEMILHDIGMQRFRQWWNRATRSGYAYLSSGLINGWRQKESVRKLLSIGVWALIVPMIIMALFVPTGGWSALGLLIYPVQWFRIARYKRKGGRELFDSNLYAGFILLQKFAELTGVALYATRFIAGRAPRFHKG